MWKAQKTLKRKHVVRWELKNKKTGKLYWLDDKEMNDLKALGMQGRYIITEITPMATIKDPLKIEIKKSDDRKREKNIK